MSRRFGRVSGMGDDNTSPGALVLVMLTLTMLFAAVAAVMATVAALAA